MHVYRREGPGDQETARATGSENPASVIERGIVTAALGSKYVLRSLRRSLHPLRPEIAVSRTVLNGTGPTRSEVRGGGAAKPSIIAVA